MKTSRLKLAKFIADKSLKSGIKKDFVQEIAAYLLQNRRVGDLDSIMRDVSADWADAGHLEVIASSAHTITPAIEKQIKTKVNQLYPKTKQTIITKILDPEILGGVRLNFANQQLDLSFKAKINKFKQLTMTGKEYN